MSQPKISFVGVAILSKFKDNNDVEMVRGKPKWLSDLIILTTKPFNLKEAREFASTLDKFWVRVFLIINYQDDTPWKIQEVKK